MPANEEERITADDVLHERHVHTFLTEADVAAEHQHVIVGVTGPARLDMPVHVHRLHVRTSFLAEEDGGHWHWVDVMTCPPIDLPDGNHTHYFQGTTSYDDNHCHTFSGVTGTGPTFIIIDPCTEEAPASSEKKKYGNRPATS
ncbi:ymaf [Lucifera butyrica]|uniref:Ymaf n=1 Tax=Lucifera butyrica TaxID=1351585 RepID=A0A498R267_9FIRM|nr:YmaF family protein [Lucifera butyrica]VBB05259.1 ymaf [Lucifera butyrica]